MIKVLILDDEDNILWLLKEGLEDRSISVITCSDSITAEGYLSKDIIDVCIVDIFLDGETGLSLVKKWSSRYKNTKFIMITAQNTSSNVIEAMNIGAIDFFSKPFDVREVKSRILDILDKKIVDTGMEDYLDYDYQTYSKKMLDVYKLVGKVARTDISVLITGETGTGKEIIANMIHEKSSRNSHPFVAVNVASIPKDLIESELFGHVKGSFTGALADKKGKFEEADRGTIFLDEIGEMELSLQSKILRVLQNREISKVGSNKTIKLDVRIIAATNKDLEKMVREGLFREDLFYRLNVVEVHLPPLRDRKEDIPILVAHFLKKYSYIKSTQFKVDEKVLELFRKYNWPGNIRELENVIQYAIVNSNKNSITVDDLPEKIKSVRMLDDGDSLSDRLYELSKHLIDYSQITGSFNAYSEYLKIVERPLLMASLETTNWNKSEAAKILGINRNTLRTRIKELNIDEQKKS
ncbi:sigma-54-dependent transcriptional regulator [Calditerrivibrio nitroreducens]|uniref:Two component, sigma54 specific, transcriptional regulator, Fis family n=1 Tax=Calditerrivibrio nitroreducens (strain DSM 19672 / NBRC 101217 / Yu37-1) TaxID=768670 RepID=E4TG31_CALNY|nr:sigma-54 dependent transcriptional regulator [Calditerrivibrio nitroreducens]ADR18581.1 two component, sigma54 specific, transcriptional regulator, Fis family [Calditerrivibrio nitroreducens DSM 19672]